MVYTPFIILEKKRRIFEAQYASQISTVPSFFAGRDFQKLIKFLHMHIATCPTPRSVMENRRPWVIITCCIVVFHLCESLLAVLTSLLCIEVHHSWFFIDFFLYVFTTLYYWVNICCWCLGSHRRINCWLCTMIGAEEPLSTPRTSFPANGRRTYVSNWCHDRFLSWRRKRCLRFLRRMPARCASRNIHEQREVMAPLLAAFPFLSTIVKQRRPGMIAAAIVGVVICRETGVATDSLAPLRHLARANRTQTLT